ncbi:S-adenosylmethionine:tRNA ribosyltransferase-isomerase [Rubricella aquisinus]|uniref:S-adenosylmethionine:tRNA ribosyltransferase-isomerase n=1 Tax=Rubricella aquisinus TaxID=2028108 RepID=A0A840WJR8_9RHOB|nr:tRNA preQ1(34) S-adenosylmethionine ribosyltransferase-isomerase QueA [Rubricella aquisinus]MBB5514771.1 S-adenosylmethionine:tRNA ribosyltransferase-isomerase [Rubricella aquisinus]
MKLSDFDFDLPDELIALRPVRPRPASRLLVGQGAAITDAHVRDLGQFLRPGDMLVFNDTKVLPTRLAGERRRQTRDGSGTAQIEATLIERVAADQWIALAKPGKRLRAGDPIHFPGLVAQVIEKNEGGEVLLSFDKAGDALDAAIVAGGDMPLPPYIAQRRAPDAQDLEDYQTVFATRPGAVAAPTASLHFDEPLLAQLDDMGVLNTRVTLHVGAGTFLPVKVDNIADHKMHAEWGEISQTAADAINAAKAAGGRIIPVGTTAMRLLESAARDGKISPWVGETDIFITPGYKMQITDGLMTNFHLPKSTLMMLVSALMGVEEIRAIYAHAIAARYRFFSYGDSSLLLPKG